MPYSLKMSVGWDTLRARPTLTPDQRTAVTTLGCAVAVLRHRASDLASDVVETLRGVYRSAFYADNPSVGADITLDEDTLNIIEAYFPARVSQDFFAGRADFDAVRKFLRLADQRFCEIRIRSTTRFDDFVVTAAAPDGGTMFLARITDESTAQPNMYEIGLIVANRECKIESFWPVVGTAALFVAMQMFAEYGLGVAMQRYAVHTAALCGVIVGWLIFWGVNSLIDRSFLRRHPNLAAVI